MTTRVWLIRHGEPEQEAHGRCYGTLDVGLSIAGRKQMERVVEYLKKEHFNAIYTSPRQRALESARILASFQSCGCEENAGLREIHFGDFEGLTYDEIAVRYPDLYRQWMETPTLVQFPNGECFAEMRARVLQAFEAILRKREGQAIALVTHGGVIRVLLAWVLQIPDACLFRLAQDYAAMNLLQWIEGVPTVRSMNALIE